MRICRSTLYELIGGAKPFSLVQAVNLVQKRGGVCRVEPGIGAREFLDAAVGYGILSFREDRYIPQVAA